ncbi:hypothetical protein [Kineosporia sp. NBRC 101731]|uniref:hypothetical protein n=1 Tax=Kineosporia sp. NBRC 101731 TaxID=3032199 RepID=UPI0024A479D3|nr:hypothetical protein [Kineosporia sp. NBRC 101731]GLY29831.1 hypothetical protein Kisp02_31960 [Kineosporia sp. NBRC 101731]
MRALAWSLVALGVLVSWAWSTELSIAGSSATEFIAGIATFALLAGGIALLCRSRTLHHRPVRVAYLLAFGTCVAAALAAAAVPPVATRRSTESVNSTIGPVTFSTFWLARTAGVTSDQYRRTHLSITVHAHELSAPRLQATVSFTDGTPDLSCANTQPVWIHEVATLTLGCDSFTPASSLRSIRAITITEP